MAVDISTLYPCNPILHYSSSRVNLGYSLFIFSSKSSCYSRSRDINGGCDGGARELGASTVVLSTHSNSIILKSNRKSRYGKLLNPYDSDSDYEDIDEDEDWLPDDGLAEISDFDDNREMVKPQKVKVGLQEKNGGLISFDNGSTNFFGREQVSSSLDGRGKLRSKQLKEEKYPQLSEDIDWDVKWIPLLDYLCTFGLKESDFIHMYGRHMPSLQINVCSAQERVGYLMSIGVKHKDIRKMILRQPQILEYTVEKTLKSHVAFLLDLGITNARVGQIVTTAPSLFSYSVENSLKPTVRYLIEEVGIKEKDLCKVVQLSPQILVQRIDISWNTRYMFLAEELGAPKHSIVKMVTKHPQLLHYSIDEGLLPRINFLRSIGMKNSEILKVLTSLAQVFSLSLENNLKPKYMYLVNELKNEVQSLIKYPVYLSLSLDKRIRPRHRFLVALKKAPKGPFPLQPLLPTDECFCQKWAGTSLDKYLAFRQSLLLDDFAQKYKRKM